MTDQLLVINPAAVATAVSETRHYGHRRLETGGFFMGPTGANALNAVAVAGDAGIVRQYNLFQISERAIDRLFTYADTNGLWIPIQFHSHMYSSRMSIPDALHGFCVEGFISAILPTFAAPPVNLSHWGWWRFTDGEWEAYEAPMVEDLGDTEALVFDEDGVRER